MYFGVVENLVQASLFHVEQLSTQGQNGLREAISPLLRRATRRIALHDIEFALGGILLCTVSKFAGQATPGESSFANGFAGLAGSLASPGCVHHLINNDASLIRIRLEMVFHLLSHDLLDDAVHFAVGELGLRLALEAGFRHLHGNDGGETFAGVVAGYGEVLVLDQVVGLGVIVDYAR